MNFHNNTNLNFYNNTTEYVTLSVRDNGQWLSLGDYERIDSQRVWMVRPFDLERPKLPVYKLAIPPTNPSTLLHQERLTEERPEEALRAPLRGEGSLLDNKTH